jgi:hypothetical protein
MELTQEEAEAHIEDFSTRNVPPYVAGLGVNLFSFMAF